MTATYDVAVVGGGLAGCAAAIALARRNRSVLLLEAGRYPRQKVCGEFVSAEALPVLGDLLDGDRGLIDDAPLVDGVRFIARNGAAGAPVSPPARSISRFALDHALWQAAIRAGADARSGTSVSSVEHTGDGAGFVIHGPAADYHASRVVDASGRWSRLRPRGSPLSPGIGLKAHFRGEPTPGAVEIYLFDGGYCGVQVAAPDELNVCALVDSSRARTLAEAFELHPELRARSRDWTPRGEELATAPVAMRAPQPACGGILRVGDAAGFLEPLFGDGISLALRSGMLAAGCLLNGEEYGRAYRGRFSGAFRGAAVARHVFGGQGPLQRLFWPLLRRSPGLVAAVSRHFR